ncbi:MAG TPA: hypothetical protein PKO09_10700 [Anaerolineae bacterium]|nr:hypothetical protein [Anaerolineae bacterium]
MKSKLRARWVLLVTILCLAGVSAAASTAASNGQPFPPGSRVEGSHPDALLVLRNLGTGASLKANSEGGGPGIRAESKSDDGVYGITGQKGKSGVYGFSTVGVGVTARSDSNDGLVGWTGNKDKSAVWGHSTEGIGVRGDSTDNDGVRGASTQGAGVVGRSEEEDGVVGWTGTKDKSGVWGHSAEGIGVRGDSTDNDGVRGASTQGAGVVGRSEEDDGVVGWTGTKGKSGVWGHSTEGTGVSGSSDRTGVHGWSDEGTGVLAASKQGTALYVDGTSIFKNYASFEGGHGDLAENYYGTGFLEGGDVVVIDSGAGLTLKAASRANDTAVAGIISTAPAMRLKGLIDNDLGVPLVIAGRTLCKVDAGHGPIVPGDLLTSSPTRGYAMKAQPVVVGGLALYRPGTIIGKALEAWENGKGLIMVLVTLQ